MDKYDTNRSADIGTKCSVATYSRVGLSWGTTTVNPVAGIARALIVR